MQKEVPQGPCGSQRPQCHSQGAFMITIYYFFSPQDDLITFYFILLYNFFEKHRVKNFKQTAT